MEIKEVLVPKGIERTEEEALTFIKPLIPLLESGLSEQQACIYSKIPESTLNHYKDKFESVWSEIQRAKMTLIAKASETIHKNIDDPKIAIEVLKRRSKEMWVDGIEPDEKKKSRRPLGEILQEYIDITMSKARPPE